MTISLTTRYEDSAEDLLILRAAYAGHNMGIKADIGRRANQELRVYVMKLLTLATYLFADAEGTSITWEELVQDIGLGNGNGNPVFEFGGHLEPASVRWLKGSPVDQHATCLRNLIDMTFYKVIEGGSLSHNRAISDNISADSTEPHTESQRRIRKELQAA